MPEENKNRQKARFFIMAFALSFFVLAMIGLIVVYWLNPAEESVPSSQFSAESYYLPHEEDNLSVLIIGREDAGSDPLFFALVRLDLLGGQIPVIFFPAQTALDADTGFTTLQQAYADAGGRIAADAIAQSFSIPVDRYADGDASSIIAGIDRMGAAQYELAQNLFYDEEGLFISLSSGLQLIDGQTFWDILRYPAYGGGPTEQCEESAQLLAAYLNQRLPALLEQDVLALAGGLLDLVETDLSVVDLESRLSAIQFLSKLSGDPAQGYVLTGGWNQAGEFVPDAAARRRLVESFG